MFKTPTFGEKRPASVLAAVAGAQTPWIKELWTDPAALFRVDDARRQLWFAVGAQLALRPERAEVPAATAELAAWLETAQATDILRASGLGAPTGWRRALGRLGPFALKRAANYLALFDLLAKGGTGGDILRHATAVNEPLIEVLAALEPELRLPALVTELLHGGAVAEITRQWMWRLKRLRSVAPGAAVAIEAAVQAGGAAHDLLNAEGAGAVVPLPPPPWPGTARMRPLRTATEMVEAAKRYNNCLAHNTDDVHQGRVFYYELEGDPGMIVELARDAPYGWKVGAVRLARNVLPSAETMQRLAAELEGVEMIFLPSELEEQEGINLFIARRGRG